MIEKRREGGEWPVSFTYLKNTWFYVIKNKSKNTSIERKCCWYSFLCGFFFIQALVDNFRCPFRFLSSFFHPAGWKKEFPLFYPPTPPRRRRRTNNKVQAAVKDGKRQSTTSAAETRTKHEEERHFYCIEPTQS